MKKSDIKIVVIEHGFVFVGMLDGIGNDMVITNARSIIKWGTDKPLGQLAKGPLKDTVLGERCIVRVNENKVVFTIDVDQSAWSKHV